MSISSAAASATIQQLPVARDEFPKKGFRVFTDQQTSPLRLVTGIDSGGLGGNSKRFSEDTGAFKHASQMLLQHWNSSTEHGSNGAHNPLDSPPTDESQSNGFECWA